jgi:phage baseplate assembly protein W
MYSIAFPDIFNGSRVFLYKDYDAIKSNLTALLASDKGSLFGDPFYGTRLKTLLWQQAYDPVIRDLIKDDIFEAIYSYMPQITVDRDNISIGIVDNVVVASIKVVSDSGIESNLYDIQLLSGADNI